MIDYNPEAYRKKEEALRTLLKSRGIKIEDFFAVEEWEDRFLAVVDEEITIFKTIPKLKEGSVT